MEGCEARRWSVVKASAGNPGVMEMGAEVVGVCGPYKELHTSRISVCSFRGR